MFSRALPHDCPAISGRLKYVTLKGYHITKRNTYYIPEEIDSVYSSCPVSELVNKHFREGHFCTCKRKLDRKRDELANISHSLHTLLTISHSMKLKWACASGPSRKVPNTAALVTRGRSYFPPFSMVTVWANISPSENNTEIEESS